MASTPPAPTVPVSRREKKEGGGIVIAGRPADLRVEVVGRQRGRERERERERERDFNRKRARMGGQGGETCLTALPVARSV